MLIIKLKEYQPINPVLSQCTLSLPPENIEKPSGDVFRGYRMDALVTNGLTDIVLMFLFISILSNSQQ